jgi:hypothetical protein
MKPFSSNTTEIHFAASHQYAPHGTTPSSKSSKDVVRALKQDGFILRVESGEYIRVLDKMILTLSDLLPNNPFLGAALNPKALLVPVPGHSPISHPSAVWPAARLCSELSTKGLGFGSEKLLERVELVPKSATANPGERPMPEDHYQSVAVKQIPLGTFQSITLVDDVVTRGATLIGIAEKVEESFPGVPVRAFALVRTVSVGDITTMICPVEGTITYRNGKVVREP